MLPDCSLGYLGLLYILTTVWALRTQNAGQNMQFLPAIRDQ